MTEMQINLSSPFAQAIIKELKRGDAMSAQQIFEHVEASKAYINATLKVLRKQKKIYIGSWGFTDAGVAFEKYSWGNHSDKARPVRAQKPKSKLLDDDLPWPRCDIAASWIK